MINTLRFERSVLPFVLPTLGLLTKFWLLEERVGQLKGDGDVGKTLVRLYKLIDKLLFPSTREREDYLMV